MAQPQPELTIDRIHLADDQQVLDACDAEVVGWEALEGAGYGIEAAEISEEARALRAVIYLMLDKHMDEKAATERYEALLVNNERTIPYLEERIQQLLADGKITEYELEDYREYSEMEDFDYKNPPNTQKAYEKIIALLLGLSADEATRYGRLSKDNSEGEEFKELRLKALGLTDPEIAEYLIYARKGRENIPQRLQARELGFPTDLAERLEELIDKHRNEGLMLNEKVEKDSLINLRYVLTQGSFDLEVRLALRDFGVHKMFEHILLQTTIDSGTSAVEGMMQSALNQRQASDSVRLHGESVYTENWTAEVQARVDRMEEDSKLSVEDDAKSEELIVELQREPLLRKFIHSYRDMLLAAVNKGMFS